METNIGSRGISNSPHFWFAICLYSVVGLCLQGMQCCTSDCGSVLEVACNKWGHVRERFERIFDHSYRIRIVRMLS